MLPTHPAWIGAWWLGYVLFAVILTILTIPMFFYPKHIKNKPNTKAGKKPEVEQSLVQQIKGKCIKFCLLRHIIIIPIIPNVSTEFPKALWSLCSNPAFMLLLVTGVLSVYVIAGVFINMPRYFEIHFHMPAFKANLGAGNSFKLH